MFLLWFLQTDLYCPFIRLQPVWPWNPCALDQDCWWCSTRCYVGWVVLTWAMSPGIWWHKTSDLTYPVLNKLFPLTVFSTNPIQGYFWVRPAYYMGNWNKLFQDRLDMRNKLGQNQCSEQFKAWDCLLNKWCNSYLRCHKLEVGFICHFYLQEQYSCICIDWCITGLSTTPSLWHQQNSILARWLPLPPSGSSVDFSKSFSTFHPILHPTPSSSYINFGKVVSFWQSLG